jgi:hypothetical protein
MQVMKYFYIETNYSTQFTSWLCHWFADCCLCSTFQVFYFKLYHRTISQIVCLEKRRVGPRGIEPHTQSIDWAKSSVARRDWNWPFKLQCRLAFLIETVIPYIAWYYMYIIQCYISKSKFIIQYVNTTNVKRYINVTGSCDSFCCSF